MLRIHWHTQSSKVSKLQIYWLCIPNDLSAPPSYLHANTHYIHTKKYTHENINYLFNKLCDFVCTLVYPIFRILFFFEICEIQDVQRKSVNFD